MSASTVKLGEFSASHDTTETYLQITLIGTADGQISRELGDFLLSAHAAVRAASLREARVNLHKLEFMNSSCFKAFITWIKADLDLPATDRYRIVFEPSSESHWQKRSLVALVSFGKPLVEIAT